MKDNFEVYDMFKNLSGYGQKIIAYARNWAPKSRFSEITLLYNDEFAVSTAETVTKIAPGYTFNILPSHAMFKKSRSVNIKILFNSRQN